MFLHKAIKPAWLFVNRILALLRDMGEATYIVIDEASKKDLQWFIACAHAINGTVSLYKCLQPRLDIFVDASLKGVGGPFIRLFTGTLCPPDLGGVLPIGSPSIFLSLYRSLPSISDAGVSVFGVILRWRSPSCTLDVVWIPYFTPLPAISGFFKQPWIVIWTLPTFQAVSTGWLIFFSRWDTTSNATSLLYAFLNSVPVWCHVPSTCLDLDLNI
jgi:hypothetical protein